MGQKHLIVVHGRSTKPTHKEKLELVTKALVGGLGRVDEGAEKAVADGTIRLSLAYYGDILNDILVEADDHKKDRMTQVDGEYFEVADSYRESMGKLVKRPTAKHTKAEYKQIISKEKDKRFVDDVARFVSPVISLFGMSRRVLNKLLPDMGAYLTKRKYGSAIRQRLQKPLKEALLRGDDVAIVSHSMGCIVAYDVLWKLSQMSEYADFWSKRVSLWMTIGSPLGEPAIKDGLYDAGEAEEDKYPRNVSHWLNIAAHDDFVAHDGDAADDFRRMLRAGVVGGIEDLPRIYTFWVGREGSNPHKLYGYLNHPVVAGRLAQWIAN